MAKTVKVDVTSDTVCPWCFVGKKNLEAAIAQLPEDVHVEVTWRPYQLNPSAPREGVDKEQFYMEKFGPRVPAIMERMSSIFANLGHKYSLGGKTGNTLDSHRLLWWALHGPQGSVQKQNALAEELFLDYFTREKYIGDREVLAAAAERVGLPGAREFLEDTTAGTKEVKEEMSRFGRGVSGVPYFRIAGQKLSGAQPPEVFVEALMSAAA